MSYLVLTFKQIFMKNLFKFATVVVATAGLFACNKVEELLE